MLASGITFVGVAVDLRKSRRYRLQGDAKFLWARPDGLLQEGQGTVRDISDRGVFIATGVAPPPGVHLDVSVCWPALEAAAGSARLHGEGTVVRVEREDYGIKGFAAAVTFQTVGGSGQTIVKSQDVQ